MSPRQSKHIALFSFISPKISFLYDGNIVNHDL